MQTILGSGGAIGTELAKALTAYTNKIRLVNRNPEKVNETDELVKADLLNPEEIKQAIKGSSVVYITIGFPYKYKIWKKSWPPFIKQVIKSCMAYHCKLVFFDNVYMYDPDYLGNMTEDTPVNPVSKKGRVRAEIANMILEKANNGRLTALIARSADFYGPGIKNTSLLTEIVFNPLSKSKKAKWISSANCKHSFTYTPDAAKATALLGNTADAYNQIWHLPTAGNPITGKEWVDSIAREFNTNPDFRVVSKTMMRIAGLFIPVMREMVEMTYQHERDYIFNSDKFNNHFGFVPTSYDKGIKEIVASDYTR